jgi:acyl carrier protein
VAETVLALARDIAGPRAPGDAGLDTPLIDGGFSLDSVSLLELVMACEHAFGIALEPTMDLTNDAVTSVGSLAAVIQAKLA